ncbi:PrgI family protein [Candidatus Uhrbacteria bacterium]|nr:PrgI family protein [Candidatus Uhrbacteria bacterium]
MPDQFVVPQFLDVESKIIGPITVRQFVILLTTGLFSMVFFRLFDFVLFLLLSIPLLAVAIVVAFVRINGQPFHYFMINIIQSFKRPSLRVWNKNRTDAELRAYITKPPAPPAPPSLIKKPLTGSRLRDLSLVVNTGGMYVPDDAQTKP